MHLLRYPRASDHRLQPARLTSSRAGQFPPLYPREARPAGAGTNPASGNPPNTSGKNLWCVNETPKTGRSLRITPFAIGDIPLDLTLKNRGIKGAKCLSFIALPASNLFYYCKSSFVGGLLLLRGGCFSYSLCRRSERTDAWIVFVHVPLRLSGTGHPFRLGLPFRRSVQLALFAVKPERLKPSIRTLRMCNKVFRSCLHEPNWPRRGRSATRVHNPACNGRCPRR